MKEPNRFINQKGDWECRKCGVSALLRFDTCPCNIDARITEYLNLLNIDLSSATFILFATANAPLEYLTMEQKFELIDHLIQTRGYRDMGDYVEKR